MAHVLIGFAEALPAPEVVFSLLAAGHEVSAFARTNVLPLALLPLRELYEIAAPEKDAAAATSDVASIMKGSFAPDFVLPLDDAGLWLVTEALGDDRRIAGATGRQAAIALDKNLQIEAAVESGLRVPPTRFLTEAKNLPGDVPLPAIVKPASAIQVRYGRLVKGATAYLTEDTVDPSAAVASVTATGPALMQGLISGIGEGVFGFAGPSGVSAWSGHQRLRMMNPHGSGSSACISRPPEAGLREAVDRFVAKIGWRGAFMVEILRDPEGTPWFMELNGRMWGSLALCRRMGCEYPAWAIESRLDPTFRPVAPAASGAPLVMRNLGRDLLHLLFVLRGPKTAFHRKDWPRFGQSFRQVLRPAAGPAFYNYDPAHRFYFLRDAAWTVRRGLKR